MPDRQNLLRPQEAADYLGVSLQTIYNLCCDGKLPTIKIGRRSRFRREALDQFIKRNERKAVA